MKNIIKFTATIICGFIVASVLNTTSKSLVFEKILKGEDKIDYYVEDFFKNYQKLYEYPSQNNNNVFKNSNIRKLKTNDTIETNDLYDELGKGIKGAVENNKDPISFVNKEFEEKIGFDQIIDLYESSYEKDYANKYIFELLAGKDYDESLLEYINTVEYRDYCINNGNLIEENTGRILYDVESRNHVEYVMRQLTSIPNYDFLEDYDETYDEETDAYSEDIVSTDYTEILEPEVFSIKKPTTNYGQPSWQPASTRTFEQLVCLMPFGAAACIVSGATFLTCAGVALCASGPFGSYVAGGLTFLAIMALMAVVYFVVKFLPYVIGFMVNKVLDHIELIASCFTSFEGKKESLDPMEITINGHIDEINALGMTEEEAEERLNSCIYCGEKTISREERRKKKKIIIPLGRLKDGFEEKAKSDSSYVYFNFVDWAIYDDDTVWLFNRMFLDCMSNEGYDFLLLSNPYVHYNQETKQILIECFYSNELKFINVVLSKKWVGPNISIISGIYIPVETY